MQYYAIKVNGVIISKSFTDSGTAETFKQTLTESQKQSATIVPVTESGKEILFG